ncbi:uncharacterized protein YqfA (UPF0365 family) [Methylobacterium sp. OAE515]|uniref:hypothetical protein n=1 Tax=Methylobacterium sp. OAE515 TaxID=2817895 RepID=UPI00178A3589
MRELGQWIIAFLIIEVVWIIYLVMAFSAANIAIDQQAETAELGPFYAMPLVMFLFVSMGLWLMAAIARVLTILARSTVRF